jgi:hypothetical protein
MDEEQGRKTMRGHHTSIIAPGRGIETEAGEGRNPPRRNT